MKVFQRDFSLTWEQTNDIYNHLTDDAKTELSFERFEDLIRVLEHKKQLAEMEKGLLHLSKVEADVIRTTADKLSQCSSPTELRQQLKLLLADDPNSQSTHFQDETVAYLWEKIEMARESPNPILEVLKNAVVGESVVERPWELIRERARSLADGDDSHDFEQLKKAQINSLNKLISTCTAVKHADGSEAVSKLVFDLMVFGEHFHKGLEEIGGLVATKNHYIDFMRSESEELRQEVTQLQSKLEEFVGEVSRERSQTGFIIRSVESTTGRTREN